CLTRPRFVEERAGLMDEDRCQFRPSAKPLDRELKGTNLDAFGLAGVEWSTGEIIDRVDGWVGIGGEPAEQGRAPDETWQAVATVLDAESLPSSLRRRGTRER